MQFILGDCYFSYTYVPSPFALSHLVTADNIGFWASKDFYYNRETYNDNLLLYVIKGTFYVEQYGEQYVLTKGMSILMKLTDAHKYYSDKKDIAHIIWFHFRGDVIKPLIDTLYTHKKLPMIIDNFITAKCIYRCILIAKKNMPDFEYQLSAQIYPVILQICTPVLQDINKSSTIESSWFIDSVNMYINDHIFEKITLSQLSASVNMSQTYFCKVFQKYFSFPPLQYTMIRKLTLSQSLLLDTDHSLEVIAHSLGFSDQSHFSKTFKKYVGTTPLSYRKSRTKNRHI